MAKLFPRIVFILSGVFFLFFFIWPIGETLNGAFFSANGSFTLSYIGEVFRNPIYLEGLANSILIAVYSTLLSMLIGVPLAVCADRFEFPAKKVLLSLILVPMIMPPFVGAIGIRQILGQEGALNALLEGLGLMNGNHPMDWLGQCRFLGVVVMNALHLYPIIFLNVAAALANVDPAMGEAAENLGCTGLRKFCRITVPLIMPGLFAGGTIIFIWAFTELGVPLMFEFYRATPVQIFASIKNISGNPFPYALVVVILIFTALLYAVGKLAFGGSGHAMMSKASSQGGSRPAGFWMGAFCVLFFCSIAGVAMLPHLGVILVSFSTNWYRTFCLLVGL